MSGKRLSVQRALLSVTHKEGIVDFARALSGLGVEILSTGGTAKLLASAGVSVVTLESFTGSPEMLDGRVKTLHPSVHGGILARRDLPAHQAEMERFGLRPIDLVCVNLYDFGGALAKGSDFPTMMENIDIGGPTLLRAAAKNHAFVLPVIDPDDYGWIVRALEERGDVAPADRRRLAAKVYRETSRYDRAVYAYLERQGGAPEDVAFPPVLERRYERVQLLRYGENPHQAGAFYRETGLRPERLAAAQQLQGKELSYNNLLDLDSAFGLALDLSRAGQGTAVFVKHNNPCGAARRPSLAEAVHAARAVDPVSAFGAVIAVDRPVDRAAALALTEAFIEAVLAPAFDDGAREVLAAKQNIRLLALAAGEWSGARDVGQVELKAVRGGVLAQTRDAAPDLERELTEAKVVTKRTPTEAERAGLSFAWAVAKHVRSNAIVFSTADRVVAVGAGQMSRVDSVRLCVLKAKEALPGTVVASDAFFPFRDGVEVLADAGATAIVQPGGSIRDEEVIRAADERGVAMIFTGVRHFRH